MTNGQGYTRIMANIFNDTTFDLELEKIKEKIIKLYNSMLEKAYKAENPGASPEEIAQFIEENGLEFKEEEEDFSEEVDSLLEALDSLEQTEDLDPVIDKDYKDPKVETGKELKSKTHETKELKETVNLPEPKGLMSTPSDSQIKVKTTKVVDPTGTQKHSKTHERQNILKKETIHAILDKERQRLLRLVEARNKEMGVIV